MFVLMFPFTWDHPRGCGENATSASIKTIIIGSPPRMRGKHENLSANSHGSRITPADAGKTRPKVRYNITVKDHPRGCGENPNFFTLNYGVAGSPPRMRGKQSQTLTCGSCNRITPADAGKTHSDFRKL